MELRNLISFLQVAELGNFTKAANTLGYTQSTISFQIKQLETELGCLLFDRINHTVSLTDKGKELLRYAHSISTLTDEFMQSIHSQKELKGSIRFVAPDSVCEDMLLNNYRIFHSQYPDIDLKFVNADTQTMFDMLNSNEADAVLTLDSHNFQKDYIIVKEQPIPMHFVAGANSAFAGKKPFKLKELVAAPFILTEQDMGYRRAFDQELAKRSLELTPVLEVGRTDIITTLLEQTDSISYLPEFTTKKKVNEGRLVYLDIPDFRMDTWKQLIHHKKKWISDCMRAFLDFVKEHEFSSDP